MVCQQPVLAAKINNYLSLEVNYVGGEIDCKYRIVTFATSAAEMI